MHSKILGPNIQIQARVSFLKRKYSSLDINIKDTTWNKECIFHLIVPIEWCYTCRNLSSSKEQIQLHSSTQDQWLAETRHSHKCWRGERKVESRQRDKWEAGGSREGGKVAGRRGRRRVAGQEAVDHPSPTKCSDAHRLATSLLAAKSSLTKSAS